MLSLWTLSSPIYLATSITGDACFKIVLKSETQQYLKFTFNLVKKINIICLDIFFRVIWQLMATEGKKDKQRML